MIVLHVSRIIRLLLALMVLVTVVVSTGVECSAQPTEEQIQQLPPEQQARVREMMRRRGSRGRGEPPQPPPATEQPANEEKPKEEKEEEDKEEEAPVTKRPEKPPTPPNPDELKAAPDERGLVQFSFRGQPWADVLQWFADVAGYSFDWQELPPDYLNLTTQRKYTIPETRDLLNRHLLARGFTMVSRGEVLSVVQISKLDPSLVARVEADDLEDYPPHDFVRVRFQLPPGLDIEKAKEDVKVLLSPHAKVVPLLATNRLLVIDAVANLRDVRDLFYSEQSAAAAYPKPREFELYHRGAEYIADQVMIVLGLDPASRKNPMELQLEQARLKLYSQMQQKGKDVSNLLKKDGPAVHIAVNRRRNNILVNAPRDLMPTIERTIRLFDRPDDDSEVSAAPGGGLASGSLSMQPHKTITASVEAVVTALKEIARLDPRTQLQSDANNNTIYAYATQEDHRKIDQMIVQLDSPGRRITVFWLRRLAADQVAGTVNALLVGEEKKEEQPSRRSFFYFGRPRQDEKKEQTGFKALADLERNRLLVWANDTEIEQVRDLLTQLGETPGGGSANPSKMRVLGARSAADNERLLRQLESAWGGKNRLRVRVMPGESEKPAQEKSNEPVREERDSPAEDTVTMGKRAGGPFRFAAVADEHATDSDPAEESPPIDVILTPDGRMVLRSEDTAALDELEMLLEEIAAPQPEFEVFHLRYSSAAFVVLNLEEYFEEELKGQKESVYNLWGEYEGNKRAKQGPATLSAPPRLRFIYDYDTNTIVVQNASESQLRVVSQLIEIYDRAPGEEDIATRRTEAIKLKYSSATDVANALKEVYRDLLSSKDKEFQGKDSKKSGRETTYYFRRSGPDDDTQKKPKAVKVTFEGALSVGVDTISNTLIVSAQEEIWDSVREIITRLDEAAKPNTVVRLHKVRGGVTASELKTAVAEALAQPWPGGKPPGAADTKKGGKTEGEKPGDSGANNRRNEAG
ncbi:MAG: secretin N-terminal domain-containing protein [Planctomycetota bacterium]